jgi:type I restriction enzyme, S subunit
MNTDMVSITELADVNPKTDLQGLAADSLVSFIPMADVTETGQWIGHQERHLRDVRVGYTPFAEEDVLFAKITPCMENGKGSHVKGLKNGVGFGSTEFHVLRARNGNAPRFLFHWLQAKPTRLRAIAFMGGSAGQQRVQQDFFINYRVPAIEPTKQLRIAYVLDTIDEAIAKSEAVIAKLKQVRAGMLHDLLSYGLDEHGRLRDPIAHPEQFKESPLGRIPREWDVNPISVFCDSYAGGTPSRGMSSFFGGDIPWVKSGEVNLETICTTEETLTQAGFNASSAKWIPEGTPLIAMYGATAGQVTWLSIRATCNQAVLAIVPFEEQANSRFVFWYLRRVAPQIVKLATGSGQPNLSKGIIDRTNIALPKSLQEQALIAERIDSLVELQKSEMDNLRKLEALKSGLQDDLLTGRIPVPVTIMEGAVGA